MGLGFCDDMILLNISFAKPNFSCSTHQLLLFMSFDAKAQNTNKTFPRPFICAYTYLLCVYKYGKGCALQTT